MLAIPETSSTVNGLIRDYFSINYKNCYFVNVLEEAQKGSTAVLDWLIRNANSDQNFKKARLEFQRIADEQALRQRSLFEALISAISFSTMGSSAADTYIEHYVAYQTYDHLRKIRNEYYTAFNFSGLTAPVPVEKVLDAVASRILGIEADPHFDFNNCWYLTRNKKGHSKFTFTAGTNYPALPNELLNAADTLKLVLKQGQHSGLDSLEKSVLGFTYQTLYGATSQEIHFSPDLLLDYFLTSTSFQRSLTTVNMLSACVVSRCLLMTSVPDSNDSPSQALFDTIAASSTQPMFESVAGRPQGMVGDYLVAQLAVGAVVGPITAVSIHPSTKYVLYEVAPITFGPAQVPVVVRSTEVIAIVAQKYVDQIAQEYKKRTKLNPMSTPLTFFFGLGDLPLLEEIAEGLVAIKHGAAKMRFMMAK
jgi:hypothetical protein